MVDLTERGRILEDEWFHRNEQEMIRKARERREARLTEAQNAEREKERALHHMRCPKCGAGMGEVEHEGIRIDRCSNCHGIFFDAGELEELLVKPRDEKRSFFRKVTGLFGS